MWNPTIRTVSFHFDTEQETTAALGRGYWGCSKKLRLPFYLALAATKGCDYKEMKWGKHFYLHLR